MLKYIPFLCVCFFQQATAQSISKRTVDSLGNIFIVTSRDTLSVGARDCRVEGIVFNSDSTNYYAAAFYLSAPKTFFLTNKDKIHIRYADGEVYEQEAFTEGEFFTKDGQVTVTVPISEEALFKMRQCSVSDISLITPSFRHTISLPEAYRNRFTQLATYLLGLNVYDENGINWSELTSMPLPVN